MLVIIEEWLMVAEYILVVGNLNVIFCECGVRIFDCQYVCNILDLFVILVLRLLIYLLIMIDFSYGIG